MCDTYVDMTGLRSLVVCFLVFSGFGCTQYGSWDLIGSIMSDQEEVSDPADTEIVDVLDTLLIRYTFDSSASPETDDSGNGHTGTVSGATWLDDGSRGGVLQFDGLSGYMEVPSISAGAPDITFVAWLNIASLPSVMRAIYAVDEWSPRGFHINLKTSGIIEAGVESNSPVAVESSYAVGIGDVGRWLHYAVAYDSTAMTTRVYVDGAPSGSTTHTVVNDAKLSLARIGAFGGSRWFHGKMDDVRIYGRALSDVEINTVFQATQ